MTACCVCSVDFEVGTGRDPRPRSRHRCSRCHRFACLDDVLFDATGKTVCIGCWRGVRAEMQDRAAGAEGEVKS